MSYFERRFELYPDFSGDCLLYTSSETPSNENTMLIISCGLTYPNSNHFDLRHSKAGYFSFLCSLIFITGGKGYIETGDNKFEFKKGDLVLFNIMNECVFYADKDDPYSALWVNYTGTLFFALHHHYRLNSPIIIVNADVEKQMNNIINLTTNIHNVEKQKVYSEILHEFIDICYLIHIQITENQKDFSKDSLLASKIKSYIDQYSKYDLTLLLIAQKFHYSTRHISRIFKKYYSITPTKYIVQKKIDVSKNLLTYNMSLQYIASYLSFYDVNHYIKTFKQYEGMTPAQYKKSKNNNEDQ